MNEIKVNNPNDPLIIEINYALSFIEKNIDFYQNDTDAHNITNSVSYYIQAHNNTEITNKFWDNFDLYNTYIKSQMKKYPTIYQKFGNDVINEIQRLQQLAGILTEIKINNPNEINQVIEDFAYIREIDGNEFIEFNQDKLEDILEKHYNIFKINKEDIDNISNLFYDYFYDYFDYDDLEEWRNPTLKQILEIINKIK